MNADDLTVLSSRVFLRADGDPQLCGNLSALPAKIAAAKRGAPDAIPAAVPSEDDGAETPDTGGRGTTSVALLLLMFIGAFVVATGALFALKTRDACQAS